MAIVDITKYGADKNGILDTAKAMEAAAADCKMGDTLLFPKGRFFFETEAQIHKLSGVTVVGDEAQIVNHFCRTDFTGLSGVFSFYDCSDIALKNLTFDYDVSPNSAGYVSAIDLDNGTFDIKIYDEFDFKGDEIIEAIMSMDDDLSPDYILKTYGRNPYEYLGDSTIRYNGAAFGFDVSQLHIGHLIAIRHVIYGARLIGFTNTSGCLVKDFTVNNAAGLVFRIESRSSNFTFENLRVELPKGTKRLVAANADGIHVAGVTGEFKMTNCYFEQLGDDALNIHGIAGIVGEVKADEILCAETFKKRHLGQNWAAMGDIIYVYNPKNFLKKGEIRVIDYEDMKIKYELVSGKVEPGDAMANTAYYCKATITDCTVKNTRARAFLLQTHNVLLERNNIFGMSLAAFLFSPDIVRWYEVGPCKNVVIRNNHIEKCAFAKHPANVGGIIVKSTHGVGGTDFPIGVHSNVTITGNSFKNVGNSAIFISATKGVNIHDNTFENCSCDRYDNRKKSIKYDIALINCSDAEVTGNRSDRGKSRELYCSNVRRLKEN